MQRGLTFSNLVTTYFTRWANDNGNMDTNLQRARWFGYRYKYIDICKIFTTANIAQEFAALAEIETDLWEQFYGVENGDLSISDILIQSENTKQNPTRKNVATYKKVSFKNKWIKQRCGVFDKIQIAINNQLVEDILSNVQLYETSAGRIDDKMSAKYAIFDYKQMQQLINHMQVVFEYDPFEKRALIDLVGQDNVPVILMFGLNEEGRTRSFYPASNKIKALQQGADNKDKSKITYEGDSSVIVDKDKINIQIHKIIPIRKSNDSTIRLNEYTQYMFAFYLPKEKAYFVKG